MRMTLFTDAMFFLSILPDRPDLSPEFPHVPGRHQPQHGGGEARCKHRHRADVLADGAARDTSAGSLASRTLKAAKKMTSATTMPASVESPAVSTAMPTPQRAMQA